MLKMMLSLSTYFIAISLGTNWVDLIPYPIINIYSTIYMYGSEYQLEAYMAVNFSWRHTWQLVGGMYGSECQLDACLAVNVNWMHVWQ